ncbi:MAG: glycosyltransferase [Saprospiraceae bacterium]|nr:glycosyltransferase [Saprospiraceae bacterium]
MDCSVLIVCYNQEAFIEECLKSAFSQQCSYSWEIVVCDDASSDTTFQKIQSICQNAPAPITLIQNSLNLGMKENYKKGIDACKGKYIALLEGDDLWHDTRKLQSHLLLLESDSTLSMTVNELRYKKGKDFWENKSLFPENSTTIKLTTELLADKNPIVNLSCCVFRKQSFIQVYDDFYSTPGADWLLGLLLSRIGQVVKFNEVLTTYRVHEHGIWSGKSEQGKIDRTIQLIDTYDALFQYKYHTIFETRKNRIRQTAIARNIGITDSFLHFLKKIRYKLLP